ncbi:MAG TPA: SMC-Scp complex subunit ScpB [Candidatus Bathyarchaeota archaeon]|nr:SMC-Scp complex subunit ScpB [Candidatus Bathyarchaeota archaeon]
MKRGELLERRLRNLEAVLYGAGRPLGIHEVQTVIGSKSEKVARKVVRLLSERYKARGRALEVVELEGDRVVMQLKPEFEEFVKQFNNRPLLNPGPLKTLSYIAFHQPVDQRQVIADRGAHAYAHIKLMENMGLIERRRTPDRSFIITTTPFYGDYFGFSHNPERSRIQLRQVFRELKITKLENGELDESLGGVVEGLEELDAVDEGILADPGDGLAQRLAEDPRPPNPGSK